VVIDAVDDPTATTAIEESEETRTTTTHEQIRDELKHAFLPVQVAFRRSESSRGALIALLECMLIALGILLFLGWIALKLVVGVTSFAVHALLVVAVIAIVAHFVGGRSRGATTT
jgi:hypothetical protein